VAASALGVSAVVHSLAGVTGELGRTEAEGMFSDGPLPDPENSGFVPISDIDPPASRSASSKSSAACRITV
jgi:hypothetical protein